MDVHNEKYNDNSQREHSIKLPKLYKDASTILKKYINKEGSIKTLVYGGKVKSNVSKLFGTMSSIVKKYSLLEQALKDIKLFEEQPKFEVHLAIVLAHELIGNNGELSGGAKPILTINSYASKLKNWLDTHYDASKLDSSEGCTHPRYVRINTLLTSTDDVHQYLKDFDFINIEYDRNNVSYDAFLEMVQDLSSDSYLVDYHIPNLLLFHPKQQFWDSEFYTEHRIILQDKASCLPVFLSGVSPRNFAIDACAAPGNKTSHLAALMKKKGRIIAVDKDEKRFVTMKRTLADRGANFVSVQNADFFSLSPNNFEDVDVILLDPSCSGSGTNVHNDTVSPERVRWLAAFQTRLLRHALSFPNVRTVMYSTCSTNEEENEAVVQKALRSFEGSFELEDLSASLPAWKHFGLPQYEFASKCIRTDPDVDLCNGFFVSKFVRINSENYKRKRKESSDLN